ncbi:MAG: hypothetical protein U0840_22790 [Gemmataceae bacterium]
MHKLQAESREHPLPSGRSVVIRQAGEAEEVLIRSSEGEVEVRITLTEAGPVVRLRAARLELEAADQVDIRCEKFNVEAREVRMKTEEDIHLNAATIRLNC